MISNKHNSVLYVYKIVNCHLCLSVKIVTKKTLQTYYIKNVLLIM